MPFKVYYVDVARCASRFKPFGTAVGSTLYVHRFCHDGHLWATTLFSPRARASKRHFHSHPQVNVQLLHIFKGTAPGTGTASIEASAPAGSRPASHGASVAAAASALGPFPPRSATESIAQLCKKLLLGPRLPTLCSS